MVDRSFRDRLRLLPPEEVPPVWRRLAFGTACGAIAILVRLPFEPLLGGAVPFVFFLPAVTIAAVRGGLAGATPVMLAGIVYFILGAPLLSMFHWTAGLPFALFLFSSGLIVAVAEELRGALVRLRLREAELQAAGEAAARAETLRRAILESSTDYAIISTDGKGLITTWNTGAERVLGWDEADVLGRHASLVFTPEDIESGVPDQEMSIALNTGGAEDERLHQRRDGSRFWANASTAPLRTQDGLTLGFLKILRDRTAEHAAREALERSERQLRLERSTLEAIFTIAPVGLSLADADDGRSILVNDELRRILGRDIAGQDWERYADAGAFRADGSPYAVGDYPSVRALRRGESVRSEPFVVMQPGGGRVRAEASSSPLRDGDDRVVAAVTVVVDVEAREQAIEHQQLLMSELAHRMKNTLSMVQAIVSQTLRSAPSTDAARVEIMERMGALSRAQDALARTRWISAELSDTIDAALLPLALGPERLSVAGPPVRVGSRAALSFTLALHELATNAVKYGALSAPGGRVEIGWSVGPPPQGSASGEVLTFTWSERGGPEVGPPMRKGFGSRLIASVSPHLLRPQRADLRPRWRVLESHSRRRSAGGLLAAGTLGRATGCGSMPAVSRTVVLVVEDEPLVLMDAMQSLEDAGFEVVDAYDAEHALLALESRPEIRAVFTDVNMPGKFDGVALARMVHDRRPDVLIVVTSGAMKVQRDDIPEGGRFIPKPYDGVQVADLIGGLLGGR